MRLALYQPDIPQNTGAMLRLAACFGMAVDIIEPCGFIFDDAKMRRSGMDYIDLVSITKHSSWDAFYETKGNSRLLLLSTKAATPYYDFRFQQDDILLMGRESSGVPETVHQLATNRLIIPMQGNARSLNVAMAAAIVASEAQRQFSIPQ